MNRAVRFALETPLFRGWRSGMGKIATAAIEAKSGTVLYFQEPDRSQILELVRRVRTETKVLLLETEGVQLYEAARAAAKVEGDFAEVGTYRGGSAKLMAEAAPGKKIHTFDTFEGLPPITSVDAKRFSTGQYATQETTVREYLSNYPCIQVYKGLFPDSGAPIENLNFAFVHLDVDLYEGTLESLKFFYSRLNQGGLLISHDYVNAEGVRRAFDEFFADKPETVIPLTGSQCLVVKL